MGWAYRIGKVKTGAKVPSNQSHAKVISRARNDNFPLVMEEWEEDDSTGPTGASQVVNEEVAEEAV